MVDVLTSDTWEDKVIKAEQPVVVDFGAVWCGPCKRLEPIFKEVAAEHGESAVFGKVDIDQSRDIAAKYAVMQVPTLLFFKGGEVSERLVGLQPKDRIIATLKQVAS